MVDVLQTDAQEYALDRDCTTLSRHVLQQLQSSRQRRRTLSALMNRTSRWQEIIVSAVLMEGRSRIYRRHNAGESVKRWMSMPMMFYLSIQAKWLVCRLASEEWKNHTIRELPNWSLYPTI